MSTAVLHCSAFLFASLLVFPNSKTLISALYCLVNKLRCSSRKTQDSAKQNSTFKMILEKAGGQEFTSKAGRLLCHCSLLLGLERWFPSFPEINGNSPLMCFNLDLPHLGCCISTLMEEKTSCSTVFPQQ